MRKNYTIHSAAIACVRVCVCVFNAFKLLYQTVINIYYPLYLFFFFGCIFEVLMQVQMATTIF